MMSRGSVIPEFLKSKNRGYVNVTDKRMTRFSITIEEGVNFVLFALKMSIGREIFVPKLPSYKILDVAKAISKNTKVNFVGIRSGEKIHEEMITLSDSLNTIESKNFFVILPSITHNINKYLKRFKAHKVKKQFSYNSLENSNKLSINILKKLIYAESNK